MPEGPLASIPVPQVFPEVFTDASFKSSLCPFKRGRFSEEPRKNPISESHISTRSF
jgi:hypothetical protein